MVGHVGGDVHNAAVGVEVGHEGVHEVPGAPVVCLQDSFGLNFKLSLILHRWQIDRSIIHQNVNPAMFVHQSFPQAANLSDISHIQREKLGPVTGSCAQLHTNQNLVP